MKFRRSCVFVISSALLCGAAFCQQQDAAATLRNDDSNDAASGQNSGQSLADIARTLRKDNTTQVQMTPEDAKKLFSAVDTIFDFAAKDTGFPKHADVKRRLIAKDDVEKFVRAQEEKAEFLQRLARSEMTMKKFGFLPRAFDLRDFLVKAMGHDLAAYYDNETKTISMLNWVTAEQQEPILAHELTHALQDQNYDLQNWLKGGQPHSGSTNNASLQAEDDESTDARHAVVEGQAMVVFIDYLLAPMGRSLQNTPGLIYQMEEPAVKAAADSALLHDAPMIMRESSTFPYREGLIFEGELLEQGGKQMAFPGPFLRPPSTTYEVMNPKAYIAREKFPQVRIPDLQQLLGGGYEVFDSGNIGELDVRALLEQYGPRKIASDLSTAWQGGAYQVFRRKDATTNATNPPRTADLALFYVSRWKSPETARHFSHLYAAALPQRYGSVSQQTAPECNAKCPISATLFLTEEGPVLIEQWPDNSVTVSESFDTVTAAKLAGAAEDAAATVQTENLPSDELALRLYEFPGFMAFQSKIATIIANHLAVIAVGK